MSFKKSYEPFLERMMAKRRLSLYGKRATTDDILEEINRLLYAKGNRPYPLKPAEIAKAIGTGFGTYEAKEIKNLIKFDT